MIILLVSIMVLCYTCQSLFTRLFSANYQGKDATLSSPVFAVCFGGFIGLATLLISGFSFAPAWPTVLFGLLNAAMLILYNTSLIEAGNRGSYSFLMIANLFGGIIVPLFVRVIFYGATLNSLQIIAVILMLISFVVMNARSLSLKGAGGSYYIWCALLFLANGLYSTIMDIQPQTMSNMGLPAQRTEMIAISYLGMALVSLAIEWMKGGKKRIVTGFSMGKKSALFALSCGIVATLASNLLLTLVTQVPSTILYTIDNGGVLVLSILCSFVIFKEKPTWEQVLGMVMAVASIIMISL